MDKEYKWATREERLTEEFNALKPLPVTFQDKSVIPHGHAGRYQIHLLTFFSELADRS